MAYEPMDPEMQEFLCDAASVARSYDREGRAVLPVSAWPKLLHDLKLQEDSEAAYFLMDHLEAAGDGYFTYAPMLRAAGMQGPGPGRSPMQESLASPSPLDDRFTPAASPDEAYSRRYEEEDITDPSMAMDQRRRGQGGRDMGPSPMMSSMPSPPVSSMPSPYLQPSPPVSTFARRESFDNASDARDEMDSVAPLREAVDEAFWAYRGGAIKDLFFKWDCNQLSNETFASKLQAVLGESVDIMFPDSEFQRVSNKHRTARNMKFASLMTALRRDAYQTHIRRFGKTGMVPPTFSRAGSSYAGSNYEPSEAGMSDSSGAAGRPTGAVQVGLRGGRKHYQQSDSGSVTSAHISEPSLRSQQPRVPAPYASGYPDQPSRAPTNQLPRAPAPYASGYSDEPSRAPSIAGYSSVPPWASASASGDPRRDARRDPETMSTMSNSVSVAESKRNPNATSMRNHVGHGNILTWGDDSRPMTPDRKRGGRGLIADAEGVARPRSNMSSNVIGHR